MSDGTKIEWTDTTWNPIRASYGDASGAFRTGWACQRVSPGCEHCYAETLNKRLGTRLGYDARGLAASEAYLDEKAMMEPLRWRKRRRVFLSSMTDVFGDWVPDGWLDRIFSVMAGSPQHTFQVLTKRAERMRSYLRNGPPLRWPLPNVWLGVSVEDQQRANERIPALLATPAAVRWLSCEPLLGWTDISWALPASLPALDRAVSGPRGACPDWVVVGGESGPGARPTDLEWIRGIVRQCRAAEVPVFVKQLGSRPETAHNENRSVAFHKSECNERGLWEIKLRDRKGGNPAEWPADLRVREWPEIERRRFEPTLAEDPGEERQR